MRALLAALLVGMLVLPLGGVSASAASGTLVVQGVLAFPTGTQIDLAPRALYLATSDDIRSMTLRAPSVRILALEEEYVAPAGPTLAAQISASERSFILTDVLIEQIAAGPGWMGLTAPQGSAQLVARGSASIEAHPRGDMTNAPGSPRGPRDPFFGVSLDTPHLRMGSGGLLEITGAIGLKINGPDLRLTARENATTLPTGLEPTASGFIVRWVVIEADAATFTLDTDAPMDLASSRAELRWSGTAAYESATGTIDAGREEYKVDGRAGTLKGDLQATLRPTLRGETAELILRGDIDEGSLAQGTAITTAPAATRWGLLLGLLLFGVALAAGGTLFHRHQARTLRPSHAEDALALARIAADEGRLDDAVGWAREALRLAPKSELAVLELSGYLASAGQTETAQRLLEDLHRRTATGEAALAAALLLVRTSEGRGRAREWLIEALDRSPLLVLEIESDDRLDALVADAEVRQALEAARASLDAGPL